MKGRPGSFARVFTSLQAKKMRNGYEEREIDETEMCAPVHIGDDRKARESCSPIKVSSRRPRAASLYLEIGEVCLPSCRYTIRLNVRTES